MGYRAGDLVVKGEGNSPVILAPPEPAIAWDLFEAVQIEMLAEGGHEIKIRIGDQEWEKQIGPLRQYQIYRFDVRLESGSGVRPLSIMPTDGLNDLVAIKSIELIPRRIEFREAAGQRFIGKREEYRNAIFTHAPSSIAYQIDVPAEAQLHFGAGIATGETAVSFEVAVNGRAVWAQTLRDPENWEDAGVNLVPYAGQRVKLELRTDAGKAPAVGLWANPLIVAGGSAGGSRPNVLIYMIDTLRADHTSLYGYGRDTTPFLRKLGAQGLVFEDCQVQATWTKPSVASMMTSLFSFAHGIRRDDDTIPPGSATLAAQLRAAGYFTASLIANPLVGRLSGLQRGFDYLSEWQAVGRQIRLAEDRATDSAALNRLAFSWLDRHREEPFFLYIHATDPHAPYESPPAFDGKFAVPAETPRFDRDFERLKKMALERGGFGVDRALCLKAGIDPDQFIRRAADRYDDKILNNDTNLARLAEKLKQLGILENTLIVVVSDHGEEFWEHGWTGHGQSLYPELTHGVLLFWNPKLIPTPRRIAEPVQLIDLMPTILDLLRLPTPNVVEGLSLAPFAVGQTVARRTPVMTSRYAHPYSQQNESLPENHIDSVAMLDASWKLIYREKGKDAGLRRVELYDRRRDPRESNDIAASNPVQVEKMMSRIEQWLEAQKQVHQALGGGAKALLDRQTMERLRSLGYLGGGH